MNKLHLALALLLVLILGTFAEASFKFDSLRLRRRGDEEDDGEDPEDENEEDREVDYEVEDDGVKIESESESEDEDSRDKAEIEIKTSSDSGALRIRVKWYHSADDSSEAFDFKVRFDEIFEYVESSTIGDGYTDGLDTIVQHYVFGFDSTWNAPTTTEGANGETIFTFITSDGVFRVDFIITGSLTETESGSTLSPNEMKIDVYINNFPYSTDGSYLALVGKVQTKLEKEDDEGEDEEGTSLEGGAASFTWATTVDADGVTVDVITSTYEDAEVDDDYDEDGGDGDGEDTTDGARRRGETGDDGDDGEDEDDDDEDIEDRPETATEFVWAFNTNAHPVSIYWDPRIATKGLEPSSAHAVSVAFLAVAAAVALAF